MQESALGMIGQETLNKSQLLPYYRVDDLINHPITYKFRALFFL